MRIDAQAVSRSATAERARPGVTAAPAEHAPVTDTSGDAVQLSRRTDQLKLAEAAAAEADEARAQHVAALKAQVQAGAYQVDNAKLAEALINYP